MLSRREFIGATSAAGAVALMPQAPSRQRNFLWGAGSSAYQIEGAPRADGKGASVWDEFAHRRGVIADGETGDVTCDFYHRYPGDIALMRELGLNAFRFSLAWTRIRPTGRGPVNQAGLDFYRRFIDALLAAHIEPIVTLFHWDTPLALERAGGWQTSDMAGWFGDYAAVVARALGDRVRWWLTINEPRSFIGGGYVAGVQAPGLKLDRKAALAAAHITLLAHGRAVQALRAERAQHVGIPNDFTPVLVDEAATFASPLDHFSANQWWDENAWWHDPIYRGAYPPSALAALGPDAPVIAAGDMETIRQPLDFIAANVYGGRFLHPVPANFPRTAFGWLVTPEALYWAPRWLHERYRLPVLITENGCSTHDVISPDGNVHDPQRTDFTEHYLRQLTKAMREGTPVLGYLHWALLDNFEWQAGFTQRFGLIYVDFPTGRRIAKDSALWYARHIAGT